MRRHIISHFREPMDIASSSLSEKHAVYGGGPNLKLGLKNVMTKYRCGLIGVATTCLTETIGDDAPFFIKEFKEQFAGLLNEHGNPEIVNISTPSYSGTHMEGFHEAVNGLVEQIARNDAATGRVNLFPGFLSPADIRYLRELFNIFRLTPVILPDISMTLDGPALDHYEKLPRGGTPLDHIRSTPGSMASLEFGHVIDPKRSPGRTLKERYNVPLWSFGTPIGLRETDALVESLESLTGTRAAESIILERGRLVDAYVDGHKYLFGKKALVYGEEDLVAGLTSFLCEIGVKPVLCASGGNSGRLANAVEKVSSGILDAPPITRDNIDFHEISELAEQLGLDLIIGHSKGFHMARKLGIPLIRVGYPIHDRFGGQRILHVGYRGAQSLLDNLINTVIAARQESSDIGYTYY
jgi:nitrogenase molybdenum-iron protein NifN